MTWDTGIIYFDLKEQAPHQTLLVFSESLPENFTTPRHKDIAGWSIVLNRLKQVVETPDAKTRKIDFPQIENHYLEKNEFRKLKSVAQRVNNPLCHTFKNARYADKQINLNQLSKQQKLPIIQKRPATLRRTSLVN